jgi:hypothetical protein
MGFCRHYWLCAQSVAGSTVRSGQSGMYAGIAGGHRAIVLRLHGREGPHICQVVSLGAAREPAGSQELITCVAPSFEGQVQSVEKDMREETRKQRLL